MKRVKLKEWKKLKPEGVLLPWIQLFPKINLILKTLDTRSHFQKKNKPLFQLRTNKKRKKRRIPKEDKKKNQNKLTREVKNNIMISQKRRKAKMKKKMVMLRTISSSVGILKKPTSTNRKKTMILKLKTSTSKRKEVIKTSRKKITSNRKISVKDKNLSNQERAILKRIKLKMTKTDTKRETTEIILNTMVNADLKGLTMTLTQRVEMTIEDHKGVVWATLTVVDNKDSNAVDIINNHTLTEATMISM